MIEVTRVIPRHGAELVRVCIAPSGMSRSERRALAWTRNWPTAGAVLALCVVVVLGGRIPPDELIPPLVLCYLAGIVVTRAVSRRVRRAMVRVELVDVAG